MIKDRLHELKLVGHQRTYSCDEEVYIDFDENNCEISKFLNKVERIRCAIDKINCNIDEIKRLNSIILSLPRGNEKGNSEVEDRKTVISHTVRQVRNHIKEIEQVVEKNDDKSVNDLSALERIQRIQLSTLVWMFANAVKNYNDTLLKHQERCKALVRQQLKIIDKVATGEELEELLEKDGAVFVDNIVADTLEAQLALARVKARHDELMKVENSIKEIRDVFVQTATLVETQGDNIKRIEYHVVKASNFTDHGNVKLQKAKRKRKKERKRNRVLMIILIVLVAIIVILLAIL
ncbi:syntaxin-1A-like [Periplaneta americana]|uniref:syntaxin-1A-like n=1 Tax=Periplaneta americana TaxID=6978 RepID=UPI0037E7C0AF